MISLKPVHTAGVLSLQLPQLDAAPLLFDSPHSGTKFPFDFHPALDHTLILRTSDLFVGQLFAPVIDSGASLLEAHFPRAYIDVNRAIDDLDETLLQPGWPDPLRPSPKSQLGKGLIWRVAAGGRPIYARRLTPAEVRTRIESFYRPYHRVLRQTLDTLHQRFGEVWHVNCHSMKSTSTEMDAEGAGTTRPDVVVSDRDGESADRDYVEIVRQSLMAEGLHVALNNPFKGAEVIRRHGQPAAGRHSIQIEFNRGLYMDERTLQTHDGFVNLKHTVARLGNLLVDFCRSRI